MITLEAWLRTRRVPLDEAIAEACRLEAESHPEWDGFEYLQTLEDSLRLSDRSGKDCYYDRPSSAFIYASWYHGRRMQQILRAIARWFEPPHPDQLNVVDLGCGTGAALWAIGLVTHFRQVQGLACPRVHVWSIDSSPFMLGFAQRAWASSFLTRFPKARVIGARFLCETWLRLRSVDITKHGRPSIVASYLLDASDSSRTAELAAGVRDFADWHGATRILTLSPASKAALAGQVFGKHGWEVREVPLLDGMWFETMDATGKCRQEVLGRAATNYPQLAKRTSTLRRPPSWLAYGEDPSVREATRPVQGLLYSAPKALPVIQFDEEQRKAATPGDALTLILGSAGSGKSLVLAQRIVDTALQEKSPATYLVTAFNKAVIDQAKQWTLEAARRAGCDLRGNRSLDAPGTGLIQLGHARIEFLNWNLVMTRKCRENAGNFQREDYHSKVVAAIQSAATRSPSVAERYPHLLNDQFLCEEHSTVVYGMGIYSLNAYLKTERKGRGRSSDGSRVHLGHVQRELVWDAIHGFMEYDVFLKPLREVHRQICTGHRRREEYRGLFDRVFIDECQDFTHADFEIVHHLNGHAQRVVAVGDPTQSVYLGATFGLPLPRGEGPAERWTIRRLKHSYRLPLRVCEAIRPLSEQVRRCHEGNDDTFAIPEPRKAATLGIRPILILAQNSADAATQIAQVHRVYAAYLPDNPRPHVTVAEKPDSTEVCGVDVVQLRRLAQTEVDQVSMYWTKGLERPFVVWDTSVRLPGSEVAEEWAFTILTRTTSILVILVTPNNVSASAQRVLPYLCHRERLMPWTARAKMWLDKQCTNSS